MTAEVLAGEPRYPRCEMYVRRKRSSSPNLEVLQCYEVPVTQSLEVEVEDGATSRPCRIPAWLTPQLMCPVPPFPGGALCLKDKPKDEEIRGWEGAPPACSCCPVASEPTE